MSSEEYPKFENDLSKTLSSADETGFSEENRTAEIKHNIPIKEFKIMLIDSLPIVRKMATLSRSPQKNELSTNCDETSLSDEEICVDLREASPTDDELSESSVPNENILMSPGCRNYIEGNSLNDENDFELHIDSDDDEEFDQYSSSDASSSANCDSETVRNVQKSNAQNNNNNADSAKNAFSHKYGSIDSLENITITDYENSDDDVTNKYVTSTIVAVPDRSNKEKNLACRCPFCGKLYTTLLSFEFHILSHLNEIIKPEPLVDDDPPVKYECVLCKKSFSGRNTIISHYKTHQKFDHFKMASETSAKKTHWSLPKKNKHFISKTSSAVTEELNPIRKKKSINNGSISTKNIVVSNTFLMDNDDVTVNAAGNVSQNALAIPPDEIRTVIPDNDRVSTVDDVPTIAADVIPISTAPVIATTNSLSGVDTVNNCDNHHSSKQYRCHLCNKTFNRQSRLKWHIQFQETTKLAKLKRSHSSQSENDLSPVGIPGDNGRSRYTTHMAHHDDAEVSSGAGAGQKCELCDTYFFSAVALNDHIFDVHADSAKYVDYNKVIAANHFADDTNNVRRSNGNGDFTCTVCDINFSHRRNLKHHMMAHKESNGGDAAGAPKNHALKRTSCGKLCSSRYCLQKHVKLCGKRTEVNVSRDEGDDVGRDEKAAQYKCDVGDGQISNPHVADAHRASHRRLHNATTGDKKINEVEVDNKSYAEIENGRFRCTLCHRIFETRRSVVRHISDHESADETAISSKLDGGFPCRVGDENVASVGGTKIRVNTHPKPTDPDEGTSDCCINGDDVKDSYDGGSGGGVNRDNVVSEDRPYVSDICHETFDREGNHKAHVKRHQKRNSKKSFKIYCCKLCSREFDSRYGFSAHSKIHKLPKTPNANDTKQGQPASTCAGDERATGENISVVECRICGVKLASTHFLGEHMKSHKANDIASEMPVHAESSLSWAELVGVPASSTHNRRQPNTENTSSKTPILEDTMECDMCNKHCFSKQQLSRHVTRHMSGTIRANQTDLRLNRCAYCDKSFLGRVSLKAHENQHRELAFDMVKANARLATVALKRVAADQWRISSSPTKQAHAESAPAAEATFDADESTCDEEAIPLAERRARRPPTRRSSRLSRAAEAETSVAPAAADKAAGAVARWSHLAICTSSDTPFECLYCGRRFADRVLLVEHSAREHGEQAGGEGLPALVVNEVQALGEYAAIECADSGCQEYFVFESGQNEAYQCAECDETHRNKLQMLVHMAYHVGQRLPPANGRKAAPAAPLVVRANATMMAPYKCRFCAERFVNKALRCEHLLKRHVDRTLRCDRCQRLFLGKRRLRAHCALHLTGALYECGGCHKAFASKSCWTRHTRNKCAVNSKSLSMILGDHKCDVCGLLVNGKMEFLAHLQSHVHQYRCANCDFGCENVLDLESHACIISTTETFRCAQCSDVFEDVAKLETHRKIRHESIFPSDLGRKLFASEQELSVRTRENHKNIG